MNKRLISFRPYLAQRTPNKPNSDPQTTTLQLFKKYAPKYLKKFNFIANDPSIISKLKRTKIIQNLETSESFWPSKYWRSFLSNKTKAVKTLHSPEKFSHQFPQKIKFLPRLTSIRISMPKTSAMQFQKLDRKLESSLKRTFRIMSRQRNFKSLEILQLSTNYADFLLRLKLNKRPLNSLENLSLSCKEKDNSFPDASLLYEMLNNHNLAKHVTSLDLGTLCYTWHYMNFKYLAKSVPHLSRLSFSFSHPNGLSKSIGNYLEACKNFEKLRSLEVNIANAFVFVKDFVPPPKVQHLKLRFHEGLSKDVMLKFDKDFIETEDDAVRIFYENDIFSRFSGYLQHLDQLKALEIIWNSDYNPQTYKHQAYFVQSLLKRVTNLQNFACHYENNTTKNPSSIIIKDSSLPQLFEACLESSQVLQAVEIGNENIEFTQFDLSALKNKFNKLSAIKIAGDFSSNNETIGAFISQLICLGDSLTKIRLQVFGMKSVKSLISLLKQAQKIEIPRKMDIELQVKLGIDSNPNYNELIDELKSIQKEDSILKQQVSLKLITKVTSTNIMEFFNVLGQQFKRFEILGSQLVK